MVTGDGRGNENIALTMVHQIFHAEHNRLRHQIDGLITPLLTPAEVTAWHAVAPASGWGYGERLFQAARFVTEMEYQHLVFEEFARKVQPLINPFLGGITSINGVISAEFAHTVYRLGHSMLPEVVGRTNTDGSPNDVRLLNAFLNPALYNEGGTAGPLTAAEAAGSIIRGVTRQVGNELDEFTTSSVRNTLVGLPLDLPAINIARGRSEGIPGLNVARRQFFAATTDASLQPYLNWLEFKSGLRHAESFPNFVAAYARHPSVTAATTVADKRAAAAALIAANDPILSAPAATSGVDDIDFWPGGLAEKPSAFGGLLGSTFNFVFEHQLEHLQDGDRFYYLQRTDGLNIRFSLEGNSFAELARRNTTVGGTMGNIFEFADFIFDPSSAPGVVDPSGASLILQADGTLEFFDPLHSGKNILFNGGAGNDKFRGDVGDDTMYGNDGNDRMDGAEGNDRLYGGNGDDVLFGGNGDDDIRGGPGNDALSGGPGFGGDILIGGDGNDFMVGGDDGVEYFGGLGNDVIIDGAMRSEGIFGGPGDNWIYDGDGHDGGIFGDNGNVFDLLAGLDPEGGDDVLGGGPGQDNHFGEGGDDIMLMSEGSNKFFGDYGFDWITLRGWNAPEFIELGLLALPNVPLNFNDLRNKYRFVDGASGWDLDDHIAGSDTVLCTPPGEIAECFVVGMELTVGSAPAPVAAKGVPGQFNFRNGSGAANIDGLPALMGPAGFNKSLLDPAIPGVKGVGFMGGDILVGGKGSDLLEGKMGNDLIDGDRWLNVQLRAVYNDGTIRLVDDPRDLVTDVFADPQRLNPGNISIVRSIVTPPPIAADCGAVKPLNCDTAVFSFNRSEYDITLDGPRVIVTFVPGRAAVVRLDDGTDTLLNIEQLKFADVTIPVPKPLNTVPNVIGLTQAAATTAIVQAGLRVGVVSSANSTTVGIGKITATSPRPGITLPPNSPVDIVVSLGTITPLIVGTPSGDPGTRGTAENILAEAGLVVGAVTTASSATVPAGIVISQNPVDGLTVDVGTSVSFVVSSGRPPVTVPNVVGQTQTAATSTLAGVGLTATVTFQPSTTVQAGVVISQTPTGGQSAAAGSAVALVVSQGTAPTVATFVSRNTTTPNTIITSPAFAVAGNTLLVAFISADGPLTTPATAAGSRQNVNSMNNNASLPALTWTRAAKENAQAGTAEIWYAFAPTARASMTVNAVFRFSGTASMTVVGFQGAANSLAGAATAIVANATGSATQPSASITTTRANSLVFAVGTDWDNPRTITVGPGQTLINQSSTAAITDTYWSQRVNVPTTLAGVPTPVNATGTGTDRWNFAAVEIRQP